VAAAAGLRLRIDREPVSMIALDDLAETHGLSAYDAAYLELALRRRACLATLGEALGKAMVKAGVAAAPLATGT
jgi:predicted nucleic acid-binding protein